VCIKTENNLDKCNFITAHRAQCHAERGIATASLSVCDDGPNWSHRLEYFENTFKVS